MGYFKSLSFPFSKEYGCCRLNFMIATLAVSFLCYNSLAAKTALSDYYCSFQVIGYYPDYWQIPTPDIRHDKITGVVFFSIYPNSDGSLNTSQIDLVRQNDFVESAHTQDVDVSICIGGWGLSDNFSPVAENPATRTDFTNHLTQYCLDYNFDGVVLDWEPVSTSADQNSYTLMIQELKSSLSVHGLTLSVAVTALGNEFDQSCIEYISWLHVMAYDMEPDPSLPHSSFEGAIAGINHWETFGFPQSKIILGLPFYGRDATWTYHAYKDIISQYTPGPEVDVVDGIHFNGINTIRNKTRYMVENKYAGVMFWEITQDSDNHTSLLTAISDEIHFRSPPDFNCDGVINGIDLNHLAAHWLMTDCNSINAWCEVSDLDHSSYVSLQDLALLAQFWATDP